MEYKTENEKIINIEKLKLGKFLNLISKIESIPNLIKASQQGDDNISAMIKVLAQSESDIKYVLTLSTSITDEEVDELYLYEIIELITLILKENKIDFLLNRASQNNTIKGTFKK